MCVITYLSLWKRCSWHPHCPVKWFNTRGNPMWFHTDNECQHNHLSLTPTCPFQPVAQCSNFSRSLWGRRPVYWQEKQCWSQILSFLSTPRAEDTIVYNTKILLPMFPQVLPPMRNFLGHSICDFPHSHIMTLLNWLWSGLSPSLGQEECNVFSCSLISSLLC